MFKIKKLVSMFLLSLAMCFAGAANAEYPDKPVIVIPCSSVISLFFNNGCNKAIAPTA